MSQCIDDNKAATIAGTSPVDWAIGLTFTKSEFDQRVTEVCNNLAGKILTRKVLSAYSIFI